MGGSGARDMVVDALWTWLVSVGLVSALAVGAGLLLSFLGGGLPWLRIVGSGLLTLGLLRALLPALPFPQLSLFSNLPILDQLGGSIAWIGRTGPGMPKIPVTIWAVGAGLFLLRQGRIVTGLYRWTRGAVSPAPPELASLYSDLLLEHGGPLSRSSRLGLAEIPSPLATPQGLVLLPTALPDSCDRRDLRLVLLHEIGHLSRGDHLLRLAESFAVALLWVFPHAWLARRQLRHLSEEGCDRWVARRTDEADRTRYAALVLRGLPGVNGDPRRARTLLRKGGAGVPIPRLLTTLVLLVAALFLLSSQVEVADEGSGTSEVPRAVVRWNALAAPISAVEGLPPIQHAFGVPHGEILLSIESFGLEPTDPRGGLFVLPDPHGGKLCCTLRSPQETTGEDWLEIRLRSHGCSLSHPQFHLFDINSSLIVFEVVGTDSDGSAVAAEFTLTALGDTGEEILRARDPSPPGVLDFDLFQEDSIGRVGILVTIPSPQVVEIRLRLRADLKDSGLIYPHPRIPGDYWSLGPIRATTSPLEE